MTNPENLKALEGLLEDQGAPLRGHAGRPSGGAVPSPATPTIVSRDEPAYFVVDLRGGWTKNPYITFWRPKAGGYAYPLPWSGRYTEAEIIKGGSYYTQRRYHAGRGHVGIWDRFAVRCEHIEALGVAPDTEGRGRIDGNTGPVVRNSGAMRTKLRRMRFVLPVTKQAEAA